MAIKKISILIPVYNEEKTVKDLVRRVLKAKTAGLKKEVIVINDGSTDGTKKVLETIKDRRIKVFEIKKNQGKGAAIKRGLKEFSGDVVVVQDADWEYDPNELELLLEPIMQGKADVVYGSRFTGGGPHRVHYFWHMVGNKMLTLMSNMLTNVNLTDMETCYKMMTRKVAKKIKLEEKRFGFEPEITAKVAKMGCRIYEVGISYHGRSYEEGKKINWKDGVRAFVCIVKYNLG